MIKSTKNLLRIGFLIIFGLGFGACSNLIFEAEPKNNPEQVFEYFWKEVDQNYSGLTVRSVNWDSLYTAYRAKVTAQTSETELRNIFSNMLSTFNDGHVFLKTKLGTFAVNLDNKANFIDIPTIEKQLGKTLRNDKGPFRYEISANNIGYIYISTFQSQLYSQSDFQQIDNILEYMKNTKSIVIDIRQNSGGNEAFAKIVAKRFISQSSTYKLSRQKIGPERDDYTNFEPSTIAPSGDWQYTNKTVVLVNQFVFSTANNFAMMMRTQVHVTLIGTTTGTGVVGGIVRELPNGWLLNLPSGLAYLPDQTVVEGRGIKPTMFVNITEEDRKNGKDSILEKAL